MSIVNEASEDFHRLAPEHKKAWRAANKLEARFLKRLEQKAKAGPLPDLDRKIAEALKKYENRIAGELQSAAKTREVYSGGPENLYELVGARRLAAANKVSRSVATILGGAWEELAALSHKAISPEKEFETAIAGVDVVILSNGSLRHTQIKTQRNTLTGSQKNRSISELEMYPHPLFAAAFDVAPWTFSSPKIERLAGPAFWGLLEIPYDLVMRSAKDCLLGIERRVFGE
jgi:hypothetical protein